MAGSAARLSATNQARFDAKQQAEYEEWVIAQNRQQNGEFIAKVNWKDGEALVVKFGGERVIRI